MTWHLSTRIILLYLMYLIVLLALTSNGCYLNEYNVTHWNYSYNVQLINGCPFFTPIALMTPELWFCYIADRHRRLHVSLTKTCVLMRLQLWSNTPSIELFRQPDFIMTGESSAFLVNLAMNLFTKEPAGRRDWILDVPELCSLEKWNRGLDDILYVTNLMKQKGTK
jgi:hypothetical protein